MYIIGVLQDCNVFLSFLKKYMCVIKKHLQKFSELVKKVRPDIGLASYRIIPTVKPSALTQKVYWFDFFSTLKNIHYYPFNIRRISIYVFLLVEGLS